MNCEKNYVGLSRSISDTKISLFVSELELVKPGVNVTVAGHSTIRLNIRVFLPDNVLDAVYDITVVYPKDIIQSEPELVLHGPPGAIYFLIRRHAVTDLPTSQADLELWLGNTWSKKEELLADFYRSREFPAKFLGRKLNAIPMLYLSVVVWTFLTGFWMWLMWTYVLATAYFLVGAAVYSVITLWFGGVDRLELRRFKAECG